MILFYSCKFAVLKQENKLFQPTSPPDNNLMRKTLPGFCSKIPFIVQALIVCKQEVQLVRNLII
jgi:hypothetical protein